MRTLVTFPGRAGDIIWALPTVRAISESLGHPVDLQICGEFAPMVDLLLQQPYLAGVIADPRWSLTPPDDWRAPELPQKYDRVYDLGYRGWPTQPLPYEVYDALTFDEAVKVGGRIDLRRPWITVAKPSGYEIVLAPLAAGFTECWFELKLGIVECLKQATVDGLETAALLTPPGSRWTTEAGYEGTTWVEAAWILQNAKVFLGDCSALHVLAVALGVPAVVVEPMAERLNPIFWPLGQDGPQVTLVRGNDGQATFDARHTAETLEKVLNGR